MSLSRYLQKSILPVVKGKASSELKSLVLQYGKQWFIDNSAEKQLVEDNLKLLGVQYTSDLLNKIEDGILLHYYEKMLPLIGTPGSYHQFLQMYIDGAEAMEEIARVSASGKGVLLATAHFGAVEFIAPFLASHKLPINVLLRFTTEQMSQSANEMAKRYVESGLFEQIKFIEIGKPGTSAALDMAAVLRRNQVLLTVFDEKTDYSTPVNMFNKRFWGGAGLHKLITFTQRDISVFTIFMLRLGDDRYKLVVKEIDKSSASAVQLLYDSLSTVLESHFEQWYFVHEELPFVEDEA